MMAGRQSFHAERRERVVNHGLSCFRSKAAAPEFWAQMEAQLGNAFVQFVWAQSAAARKFAIKDMHRPVLKIVRGGSVQLHLQPALNLSIRKRSAEEFCDFQIAPQLARQRQVIP